MYSESNKHIFLNNISLLVIVPVLSSNMNENLPISSGLFLFCIFKPYNCISCSILFVKITLEIIKLNLTEIGKTLKYINKFL